MVLTAVKVSFIAMGVIFVVLGSLIGVIQVLVRLIPYVEPPAPVAKPRSQPAGSEQEAETLVAIHAAVAAHRGQSPQAIQITRVQPLS